jgi:CubicO group peptidase (beta-lactamase class C family)
MCDAAIGHGTDADPVAGGWRTYPEMAAAGLWTTASDLARFALEIVRAWSGDGGRTISRATAEEMLTPVLGEYGLGVFIGRNERAWNFHHGGLNEGFECERLVYPELGMGAVVMINSDRPGGLAFEILRAISAEYGWTNYLPREKVLVTVPAETYDRYVGRYVLDVGAEVAISRADGRLVMRLAELPASELLPESETAFFCLELNTDVRFIANADGAYDEIAMVYRGQHMGGVRIE